MQHDGVQQSHLVFNAKDQRLPHIYVSPESDYGAFCQFPKESLPQCFTSLCDARKSRLPVRAYDEQAVEQGDSKTAKLKHSPRPIMYGL